MRSRKGALEIREFQRSRGHATQDMVDKGANLRTILLAGEWKSPAFLAYLDWSTLKAGAVMEALLEESEDES